MKRLGERNKNPAMEAWEGNDGTSHRANIISPRAQYVKTMALALERPNRKVYRKVQKVVDACLTVMLKLGNPEKGKRPKA